MDKIINPNSVTIKKQSGDTWSTFFGRLNSAIDKTKITRFSYIVLDGIAGIAQYSGNTLNYAYVALVNGEMVEYGIGNNYYHKYTLSTSTYNDYSNSTAGVPNSITLYY